MGGRKYGGDVVRRSGLGMRLSPRYVVFGGLPDGCEMTVYSSSLGIARQCLPRNRVSTPSCRQPHAGPSLDPELCRGAMIRERWVCAGQKSKLRRQRKKSGSVIYRPVTISFAYPPLLPFLCQIQTGGRDPAYPVAASRFQFQAFYCFRLGACTPSTEPSFPVFLLRQWLKPNPRPLPPKVRQA